MVYDWATSYDYKGRVKLAIKKLNIAMKTRLIFILFLVFLWEIGNIHAQSTEIRPGIILPQMTTTQRTALSATNGMLVFDTNTQSYWLRSSGSWTELPKTAANTNFWQQTGLAGNEITNTNSGGFWSANPTGLSSGVNNTTNPPTVPVSGVGTRLMWIPSRSAFRVGSLDIFGATIWDATNIGFFSFASGLNAMASNYYSTAMGAYTTASGHASTAMGVLTTASGSYSTAIGYETIAMSDNSTVIGAYNVAHPNAIFVVGNGDFFDRRNIFTIRSDNNRVGIGEDFPMAPLHVAGNGGINSSVGSQYSFFYPTSTAFNHGSAGLNANIGIYANEGIVSGTYVGAAQNVVSSDIRIKNIINRSDNVADLDLLKKLQITNYRMKDEGTWGKQIFKKVIAQEVEKVYPEAVRQQTAVIPDIYALAEKVSYDADKKELTVSMSKLYDLKIGDKLELVHPKKGKVRTTISAVSGSTFTIKNWLYETDRIFVFGREVNDFLVIDYEALSMLGISAIQALAKENEQLRNRIEKLENLEKRLIDLEVQNKREIVLK